MAMAGTDLESIVCQGGVSGSMLNCRFLEVRAPNAGSLSEPREQACGLLGLGSWEFGFGEEVGERAVLML